MNQRERLIEMIDSCIEQRIYQTERIVDYMLANGVIVPPCKIGDKAYCVLDEHPETEEKGMFYKERENPIIGIFVTADDTYICTEPFTDGICIMADCDKVGTQYAYLAKEDIPKGAKEIRNV